ncbi:MAG TPA: arginase family protein [Candidatus Nanoarchaeia archaeon]|nr:arginase family protein [Candidatus Nanoarchaeia archaeon]
MNIYTAGTSQGSLDHNKGTEKAPEAILKEIHNNYSPHPITITEDNIDQTQKNIYETLIKEKEFAILIGGDHSITQASFTAFAKKYNNPGLIMFDAHPDCTNNFKTTHEDFINVLISEKVLPPKNLAMIGVRAAHPQELAFLKEQGVKVYFMNTIHNTEFMADEIMENLRTCDGIYLTIDIDVLDPAYAPGTGYLEPGGMTSRELFQLLERFKHLKNLKFLDIVEVNPEKDTNNLTVRTAAKIVQTFSE